MASLADEVKVPSRFRSPRRLSATAAACALAIFGAASERPAHACHTISDFGYAWSRPTTMAEVSMEYADFRLGDRRGSYQVVAPSLEWAPHGRLSLALRVPIAHVTYWGGMPGSLSQPSMLQAASGGNASVSGLGDIGVVVKVGLWTHERWSLSAGVGSELPTGDVATGIGGGHVMLAPFVALTLQASPRLHFFGFVTDRVAISTHGEAAAADTMPATNGVAAMESGPDGSVLMPHSDHELAVRVGAVYALEHVYLSAGAEQTVVWSGENGGLVLRAEVGASLRHGLRVAVGYDAPVWGAERFTWRGRLGLQWAF